MLARRKVSPAFLGAAIVAASLVTGTARVDAGDAADAAEEARAERFVRRRIPGLTPEERERRAALAGELRIRGRTRLSGTVFATHVHVEPGADVVTDGDVVIYSTGGIVIDAPIGGSATRDKRLKAVKPGTGADGADGAAITMIGAAGDITINADIVGNPGADGENVTLTGPYGRGGDGGRGGDVTIWAKKKGATVTVNARIACARGGNGGNVTVTGAKGDAGQPGQSVVAIGGNGGDCGGVGISATHVVFAPPQGVVAWEFSGFGGIAIANGGDGGDVAACFGPRAGTGGSARAEGGDAGRGSDVRITGTTLVPDPGTSGAAAVFVNSAAGTGGGGDANATPGAGGLAPAICPQSCPAVGRNGSDGAHSGNAFARGGDGGVGSRIIASALAGKTRAVGEHDGGRGGHGAAYPVAGRTGSVGEDGTRPGTGGRGGDVGRATAIGGKGGACRVGVRATGDPSNGGTGGGVQIGSEFAPTVASGSGGAGGNCCGNQSGLHGGTGGQAGAVGLATAAPGKGGKARSATLGVPGLDGPRSATPAVPGARGDTGADCPTVVGDVTMVGTLDNPLHVNVNSPLSLEFTNRGAEVTLAIEVCCDGRPIGHFPFVVGGGSPGLPFVALFLANLYISEKHAGHHISVMINGKTVKEFIRAVI